MIPEEAKLTFSNSRRQLSPNARESEKVTSFIQHMLHERNTKALLTKFPTLALMFNANHGDDNYVADGLHNNSSRFPYKWNSIIM